MVSVIVTVYNLEKCLESCIDSILASTYKDLEILLVDDGSKDQSGAICDKYAESDNRFKVIHKENGGLSDARNTGMSHATGEYIMFVDGDDLIHPNMIQVLVDAMQSGDYDVSMVQGIQLFEADCEKYMSDKELGLASNHKILTQRDYMRGLLGTSNSEFQYIVVWNKLYKSDLARSVQFRKTKSVSEDLEWSLQIGLKINKIHWVEAWMYFWIQHPSSITHQGMSLGQVERINSYLFSLNNIPQEEHTYRSWCLEKLYKVMLHTRYNAKGTQYEDQVRSLVSSAYKSTVKEYLKSEISFPKKSGLMIFYHLPMTYKLFMKLKARKVKRIVRSRSGMLYVQED